MINENILDPVQDTLCPDIFEKEMMKKSVKGQLLDTIYKWLDKYKFPYEEHVKSVYLIGSSAGYQYTDSSDMDVSIETDIPAETIKKIWKELPNGNSLKDTKHPVNYYLTFDKKDVEMSDSAYDILHDTWEKKQDKEELKKHIPFSYVMEITKFFTAGVDDRINEYEADNTELNYLKSLGKGDEGYSKEEVDAIISQKEVEIKADLDAINVAHNMLKSFRKEAFQNSNPTKTIDEMKLEVEIKTPNGSLNNLLYKMVEKLGYFEKLEKFEEARSKIIDKK